MGESTMVEGEMEWITGSKEAKRRVKREGS